MHLGDVRRSDDKEMLSLKYIYIYLYISAAIAQGKQGQWRLPHLLQLLFRQQLVLGRLQLLLRRPEHLLQVQPRHSVEQVLHRLVREGRLAVPFLCRRIVHTPLAGCRGQRRGDNGGGDGEGTLRAASHSPVPSSSTAPGAAGSPRRRSGAPLTYRPRSPRPGRAPAEAAAAASPTAAAPRPTAARAAPPGPTRPAPPSCARPSPLAAPPGAPRRRRGTPGNGVRPLCPGGKKTLSPPPTSPFTASVTKRCGPHPARPPGEKAKGAPGALVS